MQRCRVGGVRAHLGGMADFKKLKVWQKAHALTLHTIAVAKKIRGAEHTALRSQMIRAAISMTANIVEGRSQESSLDVARFLRISFNAAAELEYHVLLARHIGSISESDVVALQKEATEVEKML